ncbi:MAG: type II toxin-antitoxin system VapC family toxin [Bacteroidales bacterium]
MGKEYLIDTNSVIDYLDNKLPDNANELIDGIDSRISVINRMELLAWPGASEQQILILSEFINASEVFALEEPVILKAIEIRKAYRTKLPDAIIAATALVNELTIITRNIKDFDKVEGLEVLDPCDI